MSQHKAQAIFMLPVLMNLALIFSVSSLNHLINKSLMADENFPLPTWMFYLTGTVMGPCIIAVIKILPNPSYALCAGCLMTAVGLLWTGLVSGLFQLITFGCLASFGMCLSFIASCMYFAPFFVSPTRFLPLCFLTFGSALMVIQHRLMMFLLYHLERKTFFILSIAVFITTIIPAILLLKRNSNQEDDEEEDECSSVCSSDDEDNLHNTREATVYCGFLSTIVKSLLPSNGWLSSVPAVIIWIMWGTAVDTTWLSLSLYPSVDSTWLTIVWISQHDRSLNLIILHLFFAFLVCMVKLYTELCTPSKCHLTPAHRIIFSSNYMHLGLLGAAGLVCCFFSEFMDPLHNHLLFSFTFALQFDDLSDLDVNKNTQRIWIPHHYARKGEKSSLKKIASDGVSIVCHLFCLCAMSSLAIFLGLHLANVVGLCLKSIEYLPIFSSYGLGMLSAFSIGMSLSQPDIWLRKQLNELDSSSKDLSRMEEHLFKTSVV